MNKNNPGYYDSLRLNEWSKISDFGPSTRTRYRILINLIKKYSTNKNIKILDCGCGSGNFIKILKSKKYLNVSGSDFSKEAINQSKNKNDNVNLFVADLLNIKTFSETYDLIICSDVLEHIDKDKGAINNLYLLLNKNGVLILSVPFLKKYWSKQDSFSGHFRRYEANELKEKLNKFRLVEDFGWGTIFFAIYHNFLIKADPKKVMNNDFNLFKKFISKILYVLFMFDDFFISSNEGRREFIVAKKVK